MTEATGKLAGNTKILEDKIPVMAIFDQRQTQNGDLGDGYNEEDSDNQWKVTNKTWPYVSVVLVQTKAGKEHSPTFQQLRKAQHLDPDCRQIVIIVDRSRSNLTADRNGLLVRVSPLNGAIQIFTPAVYRPVIRYLCH